MSLEFFFGNSVHNVTLCVTVYGVTGGMVVVHLERTVNPLLFWDFYDFAHLMLMPAIEKYMDVKQTTEIFYTVHCSWVDSAGSTQDFQILYSRL